MAVKILTGDCRDMLRTLPADSVQAAITSPPYWGLRDYGIPPSCWGGDEDCEHEWRDAQRTAWANAVPGPAARTGGDNPGKNGSVYRCEAKFTGPFCQRCGAWAGAFGLEPTYQLYVDHAVEVFREVRRVLRPDGTLWLNLGDSYATGAGKVGDAPGGGEQGERWKGNRGVHKAAQSGKAAPRIETMGPMSQPNRMPQPGLKPKDLCGIPWRVAFALQTDGWWLRQDIIWSKPNPMPESVTDRCTKAHEYLFLLSKSERYAFDGEAIKEEAVAADLGEMDGGAQRMPDGRDANGGRNFRGHLLGNKSHKGTTAYLNGAIEHRTKEGLVKYSTKVNADPSQMLRRNKRSVWTVATAPYSDAHFATFPPTLIEPCILAGCPKGGMVLDPFLGAGTTALVADRLGRDCIGIELNPDYAEMARKRLVADAGMFAEVAAQ